MTTETDTQSSTGLSRRTVVRGAAWSVPVVSMAATAPAIAASCGSTTVNYLLDWDGGSTAAGVTSWNRADYAAGTATVGAPSGSGGSALAVQFGSTWVNDTTGRANDRRDPDLNLTISAETNVGGLNQGRGLYVRHQSPIAGNRDRRQQIIVSFGRPVSGLQFTITDIDSTADQYWDRVELSALGPTGGAALYTPTRTTGVSGAGSSTDPFKQTNSDTTFNANQNGGNVKIAFGSNVAVSQMTIVFWSATASGQQAIYLSDFSFTAKGC